MSPPIRVFVNEKPVDVTTGASILDAVAAFDRATADSLSEGGYLTDGVGREIEPGSLVEPGLIIRVVAAASRPQSEE